jgi:hypothetical protein
MSGDADLRNIQTGVVSDTQSGESDQSHIVHPWTRAIMALTSGDCWDTDKGEIRPEAAIVVLEQIQGESHPVVLRQISGKMLRRHCRSVIRGFVDAELVPGELALDVGRYFRPSDIEMSTSRTGVIGKELRGRGAEYDRMYFNRHGDLEKFRHELEKDGIVLSDDNLLTIYVRRGLGHEYGHEIMCALLRSMIEEGESESASDSKAGELKPIQREAVITGVYVSLMDSVSVRYPIPNLAIVKYFAKDRMLTILGKFAGTERIAVGFEIIAYQQALEAVGVSEIIAKKAVERLHRDLLRDGDDFLELLHTLDSRGLKQNVVSTSLKNLGRYLGRIGRPDLAAFFPDPFNLKLVGYDYPLHEDELRELIELNGEYIHGASCHRKPL